MFSREKNLPTIQQEDKLPDQEVGQGLDIAQKKMITWKDA